MFKNIYYNPGAKAYNKMQFDLRPSVRYLSICLSVYLVFLQYTRHGTLVNDHISNSDSNEKT